MALEVTVISAEALTIGRCHIPAKKCPFVTVRPDSGRSSATTKPDPDGGSYPMWNQRLSVDKPVRSLIVEVRYGSNSVVGVATIPVVDFAGGCLPVDYLHFLSYRLRDRKGEPNGIINISVRAVVQPDGATTLWSQPWMVALTGIPNSTRY